MKYFILICIAMLLVLPGCRNGGSAGAPTGSKSVNDVLKEGMEKGASGESPRKAAAETKPASGPSEEDRSGDVDIDLTAMSKTMMYSKVSDMLSSPENYIHKTVRMTGLLLAQMTNGKFYTFCIISDVTACCTQTMEFVLRDGFPKVAIPESGSPVTVIGVFNKNPGAESYAVTEADVYAL